eukprot:TRINITY_DN927_c9_g1_i1.p1 TRINITY_DN927_c9_g1~~TRINITY_DN927_c9_g1_i1.p1  ORF type:complete len:982 (+),score=252.51 TRINITY_DN927_c9_g1_i1:70-3015(+)
MPGYEEIGQGEKPWQKIPGCSDFEFFGGPVSKKGTIPPFWRKVAIGIICFWLCLCPMFAVMAPKLQGETSLEFDPPAGHQSAHAQDAMNKHWAATEASSIIVLVVESTADEVIDTALDSNMAYFMGNMSEAIYKNNLSNADQLDINPTTGVSSYFSLTAMNNSLANQALSNNSKSTVMIITLLNPGSTGDGSPYVHFVDFLRDSISEFSHLFDNKFAADITGQKVLQIDARTGTIKDAAKADTIVIPIAFAILACFLQSWRLMIVPGITIGICIGAGFSAAYPVALAMKVQSTTPQLMMSATLALNIDYNLFLLMRFRENYDLGYGLFKNLHLMITHTAMETVLGSGSLVSLAFFSMAIIPCEALISTGICCGLTIALVVAVNITLTPAILAVFGTFFAVPVKMPKCIKERYCKDDDEGFNEGVQNEAQIEFEKEKAAQSRSRWFKIGKFIQRYPIPIVAVGSVLFAFLYVRFGALETSLDPFSFVPRNANSARTWRSMAKNFPPGAFQQYYLVVEQDITSEGYFVEEPEFSSDAALGFFETPEGFSVIEDVVTSTAHDTKIGTWSHDHNEYPYLYLSGVTSMPVWWHAGEIMDDLGVSHVPPPFRCCSVKNPFDCTSCPQAESNVTLFTGQPYNMTRCFAIAPPRPDECMIDIPSQLPYSFGLAFAEEASKQHPNKGNMRLFSVASIWSKQMVTSATYIRISTPFEPTGKDASNWMDQMMPMMSNKTNHYKKLGINVYLAGGNTIPYDFGKIVDDNMYIMLAVLVAVVVVIVSIIFKSAAIPPIMAFTIVYSTGSAFGMAYYFFQTTAFSWFYSYLDGDFKDEGVSWSVPPMAISITVALAIDYDIFMLTRIAEYRKTYNNEAAILKGLYSVGSTICGAGVIMSVAFGGLLFSHVVSLNQFSIILVTSVLLDTFLLSTILVPACGFLLKGKFWWPKSVEGGPHDEWHFEHENTNEDADETTAINDVYALENQKTSSSKEW